MPSNDTISIDIIILSIGLIVFIAHIFKSIFERTNIPDVLLLIILGIFITLSGFDSTSFTSVGNILFEIALALILFEAGIHLKFNSLLQSIKSYSFLIFSTFLLTTLAVFLISHYLFVFSFQHSLLLGIILASISPAVVIPLIENINTSNNLKSTAIVEATLTDVLSIFLVISIIHDSGSDVFQLSKFSKSLFFLILKSCAIGIGASIIWSYVFMKIRTFPNTIFTSIAFILILFGLSHSIEASAPITILFFSMIISLPSNSKVRYYGEKIKISLIEFTETEKTLYSEVIFIVKTFFFVYLGMKMSSFDISFHVIFIFIKSLLLTISIYSIRYLILVIFKKNKEGNNLLLAMIPKGLAAAVLISMIKDSSEDLILLTYGVILNSIFISSILVYFRERGKVLFKNTKQMDNSNSENKVNSSFNDSSNSKNINENFINNKEDI
mgnify:FL=1